MPVPVDVGFLYSGSPQSLGAQYDAFVNALPANTSIFPNKAGSGQNNQYDHLVAEAKRLVDNHQARVVVAAGGTICAQAARDGVAASGAPNTPIVFTSVTDPRGSDLYHANLTGVAGMTAELDLARLRLLQQANPTIITEIGVLRNTSRPNAPQLWANIQAKADPRLHLTPGNVPAPPAPGQIRQVIQNLLGGATPIQALLVTADPMFHDLRSEVIRPGGAALPIPAIYQWSDFVTDGGLMSFGPSLVEEYTAAGQYVGRILGNVLPQNIPLYQPTKCELVINQATAKALGLALPRELVDRADRMIK
jgi:putative tryptophan/tyrosine transport system substrate-binding protein